MSKTTKHFTTNTPIEVEAPIITESTLGTSLIGNAIIITTTDKNYHGLIVNFSATNNAKATFSISSPSNSEATAIAYDATAKTIKYGGTEVATVALDDNNGLTITFNNIATKSAINAIVNAVNATHTTVNGTQAIYLTATDNSGHTSNTIIQGTAGSDIITGSPTRNNLIKGGAENDVLTGGAGNDTLMGGNGHDFLIGGAGDDILIGGLGMDTLTGGAGNNLFVFNQIADSTKSNRAEIMDFKLGKDKIDLSKIMQHSLDTIKNNFSDYIIAKTGILHYADGTKSYYSNLYINVTGTIDKNNLLDTTDMAITIKTNPPLDTRAKGDAFVAKFLDNDFSEYILSQSLLTYSIPNFIEADDNTGKIDGTMTITLSNDTFKATLTEGIDYTVTNIPAGLTLAIAVNSNAKTATVTFTGTADNHLKAHSLNNIGITFKKEAFTNTRLPNLNTISKTDIPITFIEVDAPIITESTSGTSLIGNAIIIDNDSYKGLIVNFNATDNAQAAFTIPSPPFGSDINTAIIYNAAAKTIKYGNTEVATVVLDNNSGFTITFNNNATKPITNAIANAVTANATHTEQVIRLTATDNQGQISNTIIQGTTGSDTIIGSSTQNNTIKGDAGDDTLTGGAGNDTLTGGTGHDILIGDAGNDRLTGGAGNDILTGGAGHDRLIGGAGNDTLTGGAGYDMLTGGAGNDVFRFENISDSPSTGFINTIGDFTIGEDKLDFHDIFKGITITASNLSDYIFLHPSSIFRSQHPTKYYTTMFIDTDGQFDIGQNKLFEKSDMIISIFTDPLLTTKDEAIALGAKFLDSDLSEYIFYDFLTYSTPNFVETYTNQGKISGSMAITVSTKSNDLFKSNLIEGIDYTVTNVPTGLTMVVTVNSDAKAAVVTFTGAATNHLITNDINNVGITFKKTAFQSQQPPIDSTISKTDIAIDFISQKTNVYISDLGTSVLGKAIAISDTDGYNGLTLIFNATDHTKATFNISSSPSGSDPSTAITYDSTTHQVTYAGTQVATVTTDNGIAIALNAAATKTAANAIANAVTVNYQDNSPQQTIHFKVTDEQGDSGNQLIQGTTANDTIIGSSTQRNVIWGNAGNDTLTGSQHTDWIYGGAGDDILKPGLGYDTLTGGAGNDIFDFDATGSNKFSAQAQIYDFTIGEDKIDLRDIFNLPADTINAENLNQYIFAVKVGDHHQWTKLLINKDIGDQHMTNLSTAFDITDMTIDLFSYTSDATAITAYLNNGDMSAYILS